MRDEDEIRQMLAWLKDDRNPEPPTMVRSGYISDVDMAIEMLEWVLRF